MSKSRGSIADIFKTTEIEQPQPSVKQERKPASSGNPTKPVASKKLLSTDTDDTDKNDYSKMTRRTFYVEDKRYAEILLLVNMLKGKNGKPMTMVEFVNNLFKDELSKNKEKLDAFKKLYK